LSLLSVPWPHWDAYKAAFLSPDGRVVDPRGDITTSEGQSYALFFSVAAGDRPTFERLLQWTEHNLAAGDLTARLPGWKWGPDGAGTWRLLDDNPAADADLWLAYALLEAERLWGFRPGLGRAIAGRAWDEEVRRLPGIGHILLPGARGFSHRDHWRLNPSYWAPQVLARLAQHDGRWHDVASNARGILKRFKQVPDWLKVFHDGRVEVDGPTAYDAIRVPLWQGMLADPVRTHAPLYALRQGQWDGKSAGFFAALLPAAVGDEPLLQKLRGRLRGQEGLFSAPPSYFDENLVLFGLGFIEHRFAFDAEGRLLLAPMGPDAH
jgi:endoglucanase